jgi:hypothetical protein
MTTTPVLVLLVDDFEPWRKLIMAADPAERHAK